MGPEWCRFAYKLYIIINGLYFVLLFQKLESHDVNTWREVDVVRMFDLY